MKKLLNGILVLFMALGLFLVPTTVKAAGELTATMKSRVEENNATVLTEEKISLDKDIFTVVVDKEEGAPSHASVNLTTNDMRVHSRANFTVSIRDEYIITSLKVFKRASSIGTVQLGDEPFYMSTGNEVLSLNASSNIKSFTVQHTSGDLYINSIEITYKKAGMDVDIRATFDENNADVVFDFSGLNYNDQITTNLGTYTGYSFAYWVVDGTVRHDLVEVNQTFNATNNFQAIAVYHPNDMHAVLFMDHSGKYIETKYVSDSLEVAEPATLPNKVGYEYGTPKWTSLEGDTTLTNITSNTVFKLNYTEIVDFRPITINVNGSDEVHNYNDVVTVSSDLADFTHWEEDGRIVSYNKDFTFSALYNKTLVASTGGTIAPLVTISEDISIRDTYVSRVAQVELPLGYELLEYGYLVGKEKGVLTTDNATIVKSSGMTDSSNEYLTSIKNTYTNIDAYAIIKDSKGDIQTIYTAKADLSDYNFYLDEISLESETDYTTVTWNALEEALSANQVVLTDSQAAVDRATANIYAAYNALVEKANVVYYNALVSEANAKTEANYTPESWSALQTTLNNNIVTGENTQGEVDAAVAAINTALINLVLKSFTVTFDSLTQDVPVSNEVVDINTAPAEPVVTRSGYELDGWYLEETFNTAFNFTTGKITKDTTLYAKWTKVHEVTFVTNGGTAIEQATVRNGETLTGVETSYEGHVLEGWYTDEGLTTVFSIDTPITQNITLYAKWEEKIVVYTTIAEALAAPIGTEMIVRGILISRESNDNFYIQDSTGTIRIYQGGSNSSLQNQIGNEVIVVGKRAEYQKVQQITHTSFEVKELSDDFAVLYNFTKAPELTLTIEEPKNIVLSFDTTNDVTISWTSSHPNIISDQGVVTLPNEQTVVTLTLTISKNAEVMNKVYEITVHKMPVMFNVHFNSNGGSAVESVLAVENKTFEKPVDPTRENLFFAGWFKDEALEVAWNFETDVVTQEMTLYAKWEEEKEIISVEIVAKTDISGSYNARTINKEGIDYTFSKAMLQGSKIQMANPSNFKNTNALGKIVKITFVNASQGTTFTMKGGASNSDINTTIASSKVGTDYVFDFSSGEYSFFIFSTSSAPQFTKVIIEYQA